MGPGSGETSISDQSTGWAMGDVAVTASMETTVGGCGAAATEFHGIPAHKVSAIAALTAQSATTTEGTRARFAEFAARAFARWIECGIGKVVVTVISFATEPSARRSPDDSQMTLGVASAAHICRTRATRDGYGIDRPAYALGDP